MAVVLFILILVILIIGHEFGHFTVAKLSGMKVPEFGLGFPPKLWGIKRGDTEYTINALPFGGFVKIVGEDMTDETEKDPTAFGNRPKYLQAATLLAGPSMNLLLAFVFSSLAFISGVPAAIDSGYPPEYIHGAALTVLEVVPGSPAEKAGLRPGDQIMSAEDGHYQFVSQDPADLGAFVTRAGTQATITMSVRTADGAEEKISAQPVQGLIPDAPSQPALGVATASVGTLRLPFVSAVSAGGVQTLQSAWAVLTGIASLIFHVITLSADLSGVAGPVGIAALTGSAAAFGFGSLLSFAALISVNLGVLNLFPFPALDGGRFAFVIAEAISRRRIPAKVVNAVNVVGFSLLILLMLVITVHDIFRIAA